MEADESSPIDVVRATHAALVANDFEALGDLVADDAVWHTTDPDGHVRTYAGRDAIVEALRLESERGVISISRIDASVDEPEVDLFAFQPIPTASLVRLNTSAECNPADVQTLVVVDGSKVSQFGSVMPRF